MVYGSLNKINFPTKAGMMQILFNKRGIYSLTLPGAAADSKLFRDGTEYSHIIAADFPWPGFLHDLQSYFNGVVVDFSAYPLDLNGYSPFALRVLMKTRTIAYGCLQTYGSLARDLGIPGGARAVGQALGRNRHLIVVPCHRIVSSNGGLGGFSSGLHWKKFLLSLEKSLGNILRHETTSG
ncbi:MAG: methylated-DNA--[protein]-cysteine S-methyltransferase [Dethiobacteria bacterium]|jgi:methylated-DNA-[protein]-cysteine S-methyltransferase|nr:methylated-DNA--[protein]-cysteine S-methyltransferase [Bacillota bacterium]